MKKNVKKPDCQIRKIESKEVRITRTLWETIFSEDSKQFVDYYYDQKAPNNKCFVIEVGDTLISMLHLTPYEAVIQNDIQDNKPIKKRIKVNYIVGVATLEAYRHRGYMALMLQNAMNAMNLEKEPFTFLMPADKAIYEPFGFCYIYDRSMLEWKNTIVTQEMLQSSRKSRKQIGVLVKGQGSITIEVLRAEDIPELVVFANEYLEKRYQVFLNRSETYYEILQKEIASQYGDIFVLKKENQIKGYFLFTNDKEIDIQEAIMEEEWIQIFFSVPSYKKPIIMARIVNLKEMVPFIKIKSGYSNFQMNIQIEDSLLPDNNGSFCFLATKEKCEIQPISKDINIDAKITIQKLTSFFFGYESARQCFELKDEKKYRNLESLSPLSNSFINEIV